MPDENTNPGQNTPQDTSTNTHKQDAEQAKTDAGTLKTNLTTHRDQWLQQKNGIVNWLKENVASRQHDFNAGDMVNHLTNDLLTRDEGAFNVAQDFLKDAQSHLNQLARDGGATVTSSNPANTYVANGTQSDNVTATLSETIGWTPTTQPSSGNDQESGSGE